MNTPAELVLVWRARADDVGRFAPAAGEAFREAAAQLERALAVEPIATLSPHEAAAVTHYHPESICRMIRQGKVKNYGTKHRPRVRLDELPRKAAPSPSEALREKPRHVAGSIGNANDIARDALKGRIGRG